MIFWVDNREGTRRTYDDLVNRLNEKESYQPVLRTRDAEKIFENVIISIILGRSINIIDPSFSKKTLDKIGCSPSKIASRERITDLRIEGVSDLSRRLTDAPGDWQLSIYTSGTTGTPKRVTQSLRALTRSVRRSKRFRNHVWAFAYNPTHFGGLQVFFQAVANLNPMVNIFQSSPAQIEEALHEFGVTHISATPTFYRLRLQRLNGTFPEVQRLTSGGEKFEPSLRDVLGEIFPNAEFRNVYALTEAGSLLESNDEFFRIPGDLSDRIQVTDENELVVHESLLGEVDEEKIADGWFKTGDLIEYVDDEHFRFVGRKSEFVNVGGYRVNPHEIEEFISRIDGVEAVVVSSRSSSVTGNILTAKIQTANDADDQRIKDEVQEAVSTLDSWKQPRIIRVEDELKLSRSGKRVR